VAAGAPFHPVPAGAVIAKPFALDRSQSGPAEQRLPCGQVVLLLPRLHIEAPKGDADQDSPRRREHAPHLGQRCHVALLDIGARHHLVMRIVSTDMLQRRDAQDQVEPAIGKRHLSHVGMRHRHPGNLSS
jgi:hypothetical protein